MRRDRSSTTTATSGIGAWLGSTTTPPSVDRESGLRGLGVEPIGAAGADGDDEGQQGQPSRDTGVRHRANLAPQGAGAVAYHGPRDGGVAT